MDWPAEHSQFVSDFITEESIAGECELSFAFRDKMMECHGVQFIDSAISHFLHRNATPSAPEFLCADPDWTHATIYSSHYSDPNYTLPLAAICSRFSCLDALLLHGSFVDFNGDGIVFTGYSGVGKTTQATLWHRYFGADIVNGDKLFLRVFEDGVQAYGLPWKGSSSYCLNRKAPVKAIVVLRQAKENSIRKLDSFECMEFFMPHIFLPHWDEDCLSKALDTFGRILDRTPVWLLECRPDEASVWLTRNSIYG